LVILICVPIAAIVGIVALIVIHPDSTGAGALLIGQGLGIVRLLGVST
jgi:hypothetical protein